MRLILRDYSVGGRISNFALKAKRHGEFAKGRKVDPFPGFQCGRVSTTVMRKRLLNASVALLIV